ERPPGTGVMTKQRAVPRGRCKANRDLPPAAEGIESPYDTDARYRQKRDTQWTGYRVRVRETCEPTPPHLLTHVKTTAAPVPAAQCRVPIQQALVAKALPPRAPLVEAAYSSAALLAKSQAQQGMTLRGPPRPPQGWQAQGEGGYTVEQFDVDALIGFQ